MLAFVRDRRIVLPLAGLAIAVLVEGRLRADDLLAYNDYAFNDVDYEIIPTAHHGDCHCRPRRSYRLEECYPCPPEPVTEEEAPAEEAAPPAEEPAPEVTAEPYQPFGGVPLAMAGSGRLPGYIDDARIRSRVRVRYDNMQDADEPTRAEFWYPTLGDFGGEGPVGGGVGAGAGQEVDLQELATYVEAAYGPRFSVFGEFPVRWVDEVNFGGGPFDDGTQEGAGDFRAGLRYGLIACPDEWLTLQVRAWAPTGEARRALGVGHSSIDVALLYAVQTSQRTSWFAEIQDWQTIDAETATILGEDVDLDGNVLRYGVGVGYDLWQSCGCRPQSLTALFEVVGWTVLDGVVTSIDPNAEFFEDAEGDTIVNGKYGLRYNFCCESFYVGYGHNWTDDLWYSDILRLELTHFF
jgi:hypothetical protein